MMTRTHAKNDKRPMLLHSSGNVLYRLVIRPPRDYRHVRDGLQRLLGGGVKRKSEQQDLWLGGGWRHVVDD
jgi:hypothetical protein